MYDEKDFADLTNTPHWVAGLYDGKLRMPINRKGFDDRELEALTHHELTHAFIASMSNSKAPPWINEGLAEYEENKVRRNDDIVFKAAIKTNTLIPLEELMSEKAVQTNSDALKVGLFYQESFDLVRYLVERYHMYRLKDALAEFGEGKNSSQVLEDVLKISIPRLEREWKESLIR